MKSFGSLTDRYGAGNSIIYLLYFQEALHYILLTAPLTSDTEQPQLLVHSWTHDDVYLMGGGGAAALSPGVCLLVASYGTPGKSWGVCLFV